MARGLLRSAPALTIAAIALFVALGGSVYAATKIDGHSIKVKSLPGNRLALGSVPANRLKPGAIPGSRLAPGSITGTQVDTATLGQVPSAIHADNADSARDAETALNAVNAVNATTVNGRNAGCAVGSREFAGACWQNEPSSGARTAPDAASACASQGGELPGALALVAFSAEAGITIDVGGEWTSDIPGVSGPGVYSVVTLSTTGQIDYEGSTESRKYRCVIPLVS